MHKADDEKIPPADGAQRAERNAARREHIGDERDDGGQKLQKRAVDAADLMDGLVEQDDGRVKHRRAEAEENALEIVGPARVAEARDEHKAERGHEEAEKLFSCQLFMEEDGTDERDDDGCKVIAQRGDGDARIAVGLKEQYPVHAHRRAGEE